MGSGETSITPLMTEYATSDSPVKNHDLSSRRAK